MRRAALCVVALFVALHAVGCGTISNQYALGPMLDYRLESRHQRLYGGVRSDGEMIGKIAAKVVRGEPDPAAAIWPRIEDGSPYNNVFIVPFVTVSLLADMPLSFVADTFMLPGDICYQWLRLTGREPLNPFAPRPAPTEKIEASPSPPLPPLPTLPPLPPQPTEKSTSGDSSPSQEMNLHRE